MDFEWDEVKARTNQRKHQVSFWEAVEVFSDDYSSCINDPDHSIDEQRYLLFGTSLQGNYVVVSFTEKKEKIRIISARPMTRQERTAYEQRRYLKARIPSRFNQVRRAGKVCQPLS